MIVSPWYPVPPVGYGGIELMAYNLARELHVRGHQVCVIGQQGTKGPFEVAAVAPESWSERSTSSRGRAFSCTGPTTWCEGGRSTSSTTTQG